MGAAWRIGRLWGIPVEFDLSGVIVAIVIAFTLATGAFPTQFPNFDGLTYAAMGVSASILLYGSVLVHELGHCLVARRDGLGVEGITLFAFGGIARLAEEPRSAREEFRMAAAGPATSLLVGFALAAVIILGSRSWYHSPLLALTAYLAAINAALGLFNLVPGFPLDGGRMFRAVLWGTTGDLRRATWASAALGQGVALLLIFWGGFRLYDGVQSETFLNAAFAGFMLIFTGLFLAEAGRRSYQAVLQRQSATVEVEDQHD
jgi:Zn-dependent protease